jgi:hypothetical protein
MKKTLLGAAVVVALSGGSAFAADAAHPIFTPPPPVAPPCGWSGVVALYGVWGDATSTDDYIDATARGLGGYGKANKCMGNMGLQLDSWGEVAHGTDDLDSYTGSDYGGAAHLYMRNDRFAIGGLAGISALNSSYDGADPGFVGLVGGDLHAYVGQVTLALQGVYYHRFGYDTANMYDEFYHGWTVSGEARVFIGMNTKITGLIGYHYDWEDYNDYTVRDFFFGGGIEHQINQVSLFANVTRHKNDIDGTDVSTTVLKFGGAVHFGQPDLITEDRKGASFGIPQVENIQNLANSYYR